MDARMFLRLYLLAIVLSVQILSFCFLNFCGADESSSGNHTNKRRLAESKTLITKAVSQDASELSPKEILKKVFDTYGKCTAYKDSGIATTEYTSDDGSKGVFRWVFRTAFRRQRPLQNGHKFRFAYRLSISPEHGYDGATVLWHNGQETMIQEEEPGKFERQESLGRAIARLTGVSGKTSRTIPALLMPHEVRGVTLLSMAALKTPAKEQIRHKECFRIEGRCWGKKVVLWIEVSSLLIFKIKEYKSDKENTDVKTTEYFPAINEKFADVLLEKQVADEWKRLKSYQK